jgi:hypothetical protein
MDGWAPPSQHQRRHGICVHRCRRRRVSPTTTEETSASTWAPRPSLPTAARHRPSLWKKCQTYVKLGELNIDTRQQLASQTCHCGSRTRGRDHPGQTETILVFWVFRNGTLILKEIDKSSMRDLWSWKLGSVYEFNSKCSSVCEYHAIIHLEPKTEPMHVTYIRHQRRQANKKS